MINRGKYTSSHLNSRSLALLQLHVTEKREIRVAPESSTTSTLVWGTNRSKTQFHVTLNNLGLGFSLSGQPPIWWVNWNYSPQKSKDTHILSMSTDVDKKPDTGFLRPRTAMGITDRAEYLLRLTWIGFSDLILYTTTFFLPFSLPSPNQLASG